MNVLVINNNLGLASWLLKTLVLDIFDIWWGRHKIQGGISIYMYLKFKKSDGLVSGNINLFMQSIKKILCTKRLKQKKLDSIDIILSKISKILLQRNFFKQRCFTLRAYLQPVRLYYNRLHNACIPWYTLSLFSAW